MRTKLTLCLISAAAFIVAVVLAVRFEGARLQGQYRELRIQQEELRLLLAERARLQDRLAEARRRTSPGPASVRTDEPLRADEPTAIPSLVAGEWTPSSSWRNEGRKTAQAAVATLLWAAAGGDLRTWQAALEFNDTTHRKARELFARLSSGVQSQYASAEDLVASVAMTKIPATAAQLMWLRQTDADHAVAGLLLANPDRPTNPVSAGAKATAAEPPRLPDQGRDKAMVLTLHRTHAGWRVIVPDSAVDRIASELTAAPAKL